MGLLLLRHQRRVETRVVVHLELAVDLEVRAPGAAIGQQRVEASREIGALLVQPLQLARARLAVRVVDVAPLGLQAHANDPHRPDVARALQQRLAACSSEVRFSVLVWPPGGDAHARQHALRDLAQSMHPHWELLWPRDGADDAAIDPHLRLFEAGGSTGPELLEAALLGATGTHLALLPHGWTVAPHALLLAAEAADRFAHARLIYGDDGRVGWHGQPHSPDLRCDWNRELLRSTPYIDGLVVARRDAWPQFHSTTLDQFLRG